jgi:AcrR family transcriptional regulator
MSKDERRRNLLKVAFEIIASDGTDALTLPSLAERAGVSRPVAYEHFESREGLLMALYRDYDEELGPAWSRSSADRLRTETAAGSRLLGQRSGCCQASDCA